MPKDDRLCADQLGKIVAASGQYSSGFLLSMAQQHSTRRDLLAGCFETVETHRTAFSFE